MRIRRRQHHSRHPLQGCLWIVVGGLLVLVLTLTLVASIPAIWLNLKLLGL